MNYIDMNDINMEGAKILRGTKKSMQEYIDEIVDLSKKTGDGGVVAAFTEGDGEVRAVLRPLYGIESVFDVPRELFDTHLVLAEHFGLESLPVLHAVVFTGCIDNENGEALVIFTARDDTASFGVWRGGVEVTAEFDRDSEVELRLSTVLNHVSKHVLGHMKASRIQLPHGGAATVMFEEVDTVMVGLLAETAQEMDGMLRENAAVVQVFGTAELGTYLAVAQIDRGEDAMEVGRAMMEVLSNHAAPVAIIVVDPHNTEARVYSYDYRTDTVYPNIKDAHDLEQALKKAQA